MSMDTRESIMGYVGYITMPSVGVSLTELPPDDNIKGYKLYRWKDMGLTCGDTTEILVRGFECTIVDEQPFFYAKKIVRM